MVHYIMANFILQYIISIRFGCTSVNTYEWVTGWNILRILLNIEYHHGNISIFFLGGYPMVLFL
jgi:hypothetical protein